MTPPDRPQERPRGSKPPRVVRWLLAALAVALLSGFALRAAIGGPWLAALIEHAVERRTGVRVAIGAIEASGVDGVAVRRVRTLRPAGSGPMVSFDIDELTARYSPLDLLRGLDAFVAGARVEVSGARVALRLAPGAGGRRVSGGVSSLPSLAVRGLDLQAERPGLAMRATGIEAHSTDGQAGEWTELALTAAALTVTAGGLEVGPLPVAATFRRGLAGLTAEVSVPGREARATASYANQILEARIIVDAVALGARVLRLPGTPFSGTLTGDAEIRADPGHGVTVSGMATVESALVRGVPVERLTFSGGLEAGRLQVRSLEVVTGANQLAISDAVVPLQRVRATEVLEALRASSGSFSARLADVPALLAVLGRPLRPPGAALAHRLELEGSLNEGVLVLTAGRLSLARGGARVVRLLAEAPPVGAGWQSTRVDAEIEVDLPDVGLVSALLPLPTLAGSLRAHLGAAGTLQSPAGTLQASARRLAVAGRALGDLEFDAGAGGGRLLVRVASLANAGGANRMRVEDLALRAADLLERRWQALLLGAAGSFTAELRDVPALLALAGRTSGRGGAAVPPHVLRLAGRVDRGTLSVSAGELVAAGGRVTVNRGRAVLPSGGGPWRSAVFELEADADVPDLSAVAAALGLPPLHGALRAAARLRGTAAAPAGSLQAHVSGLAAADVTGVDVDLDAEGAGGLVRISRHEIRRGADRCSVSGALAPAEGRLEGAQAAVLIAEVSEYRSLLPVAWPALSGRLEGEVRATGPLRAPEGTFAARVDGAAVGAAGPFAARAAGTLAGGGADLGRLTLAGRGLDVALAGRVDPDPNGGARLRLTSLTLRRGAAAAVLPRPALVQWTPPGVLATEGLSLTGARGSLTVAGRLALSGGESDVALEVAGLDSDGWLEGALGQRVAVRGLAARLRLTGSRERPHLSLAGTVAQLAGAAAPGTLAGRFDLAYDPGTLTVAAFEWSGSAGLRARAQGRLPLDVRAERLLGPGPIELAVSVDAPDVRELAPLLGLPGEARGAVEAKLALGGSWREPTAELTARVTGAEFAAPALKGLAPTAAPRAGAARAGRVEISSLKVSASEVDLEADGAWSGSTAVERLMRGERPELTGSVALRGRFTLADLSRLRALAGSPRTLAGRLSGEFAVGGPARDPTVEGQVRLEDGAIDWGGGVPPLQRLTLAATFSGRTASITRAAGEAAGAPFTIGGTLAWDETGPRLDLTLTGTNVLLYRDEHLTARADVNLRARGPVAKLRIEGSAALQNSVYSRNVNIFGLLGLTGGARAGASASAPPFSLRRAPWRDLEFSVGIGARSPLVIKSNLASGSVRPALTLTGTGSLPVLAGDVFVDPTRVTLPGGALRIERGIISFPQPGAGEPQIELTGRGRLAGYDVTAVVGGKLRAPEVTLSSLPPLPDDELLLLVLTGTPPGTVGEQAAKRILEANLARFVAESLLGAVANVTGSAAIAELSERIDVEVGRNVTRSGTATIETRFRIAGGASGPGRQLFLTGGSDIYDTYAMGVTVVFRFR